MFDCILIDYDPFAMESLLVLIKDGQREFKQVTSDLEQLSRNVTNLCYNSNIFLVKVSAPFKISSVLTKFIQEIESTEYSNNKIEIEEI